MGSVSPNNKACQAQVTKRGPKLLYPHKDQANRLQSWLQACKRLKLKDKGEFGSKTKNSPHLDLPPGFSWAHKKTFRSDTALPKPSKECLVEFAYAIAHC